jgi:ubiquinone/menaquinone biosynthesis C-methylase UbiE
VTVSTMNGALPSVENRPSFDTIAGEYDRIFTYSLLGKAQRSLIHAVLRKHFRVGQRILELNCGTGEDALYLASQGLGVVACDISERMIDVALQKAAISRLNAWITFAVCANEHLDALESHAPFDGALSNFGGLNCSEDLTRVSRALSNLIRPGGEVFLCLLGRFCAWEIVWHAVHWRWGKAFRRMKAGGTEASIGGAMLRVHYPSVREVRRAFAPDFRLRSWRGIGVVLPPSWMEHVFYGHPSLVNRLTQIDRWLGAVPVLRGAADHILFRFVREGK